MNNEETKLVRFVGKNKKDFEIIDTNIYICMIARTSTIGIVYCTGTVCGLRLGKQNIRAGHLRQLSRQSEPVLRGNILNELANQISYGI